MDIQTMVKQLLREIRIDSTAAGSQAEIDAKIAIIDAMDQIKKEGLWYNRAWYNIETVSEQYEYPLPNDFLHLQGDVSYISSSQDPVSRHTLHPSTVNLMQEVKFLGTEPDQAINSGTPSHYAIDSSTNRLLLMPIPWVTGDRLEFQYVYNVGVPTYQYTGSAWVFYEPGTTTTLPATYTNPLLREGYRLVFFKAAYHLLTGPYGGTEPALIKATEYIKKWAEELQRIRGEAVKRQFVPAIRMHI